MFRNFFVVSFCFNDKQVISVFIWILYLLLQHVQVSLNNCSLPIGFCFCFVSTQEVCLCSFYQDRRYVWFLFGWKQWSEHHPDFHWTHWYVLVVFWFIVCFIDTFDLVEQKRHSLKEAKSNALSNVLNTGSVDIVFLSIGIAIKHGLTMKIVACFVFDLDMII